MGDEVRQLGRVIPRAIIIPVLDVMVLDLSMNIGILGVLPVKGPRRRRSSSAARS